LNFDAESCFMTIQYGQPMQMSSGRRINPFETEDVLHRRRKPLPPARCDPVQ